MLWWDARWVPHIKLRDISTSRFSSNGWEDVLDSHLNSDVVILALFLLVFSALINIEFKFLVSIKMYHIQRIQQIKRLFSVVSTPSTCYPSPLPSRWSCLYSSSWSSCPLFWSRSGKDMILLLRSARWNKCFLLLHSPVIPVSCFTTPSPPYIGSFFFSPDASLLSSIRNKYCPMTTYTLRFGSIPLHG